MDLKLWQNNIYNSVRNISDIETQYKLWLGKDPNFASSYIEEINMLYDNFSFKDFLNAENLNQLNLNKKTIEELKSLDYLIENYEDKITDKEILADKKWHDIVEQAKKIIKVWSTPLA